MIIKHGMVAFSGNNDFRKCSVKIEDGRITEIGDDVVGGDEEFDAEGLYVFPGMIDPHVHFNTPGFEEREDFYHGSCFAASGGVTSVIDMPCTSLPPITNLKNFENKLAIVKKQSVIDFAFYGGVSAESFGSCEADMRELAPYVAGFKVYLISGMETFGALSYQELEKVLRIAKTLKRPVLVHAEDSNFIRKAEKRERNIGDKPVNYYRSRPEAAELMAVSRIGILTARTSGDIHIVHISNGEAVEIAKRAGISVETCPHYMAFSLADFQKQGSVLKVAPSLKQSPANEELWSHLRSGAISFVASDHAASRDIDKNTGSIWNDYGGIAGVGTMFPYSLSEGFMSKRIGLARFLEIIAENAAKRYGMFERKGSIEIGKDADLVIVDPKQNMVVKGEEFLSKGKQTPWEGVTFQGKVVKTIRRGEVVFDDEKGILAEAGSGGRIILSR